MAEPQTDYDALCAQLDALLTGETDTLANTANMVALIWQALPDINWAGVYVLRDSELVLGPFQGKPACVRIPLGKGVCGTAALQGRTLRVDNVHDFEGHIACDAASRSELVVPLFIDATLLGVLDIDSPSVARFTSHDQQGIEQLAGRFGASLQRNAKPGAPFL